MTKIMCVANQKGGVGKTTSAINISAVLGAAGHKVLLVDMDPQENATKPMLPDNAVLDASVRDVMHGAKAEDVIVESVCDGVHLLPSEFALATVDDELNKKIGREQILRKALIRIKDNYDYIIIDCPPALNLLSVNAMTAADGILIPIHGYYSMDGLKKLLDVHEQVRDYLNKDLEVSAIFMTMSNDRTNLESNLFEILRGKFGDKLMNTKIPVNIKLDEAPAFHQSILTYAPESKGAEAYQQLTKELLSRWEDEQRRSHQNL